MAIQSPLNDYQEQILLQAREMRADEPPAPWGKRIVIPAAGVFAGGWDKENNLVLLSGEGYSVSDPLNGHRLIRDRDAESMYRAVTDDYLRFLMPHNGEEILLFGLNGGDGSHVTEDGWGLKSIHPWWPNDEVILKTPFVLGSGLHGYLDRAYRISLTRLENTELRCGFSPSGKHFAIVASAGAEVFSRE